MSEVIGKGDRQMDRQRDRKTNTLRCRERNMKMSSLLLQSKNQGFKIISDPDSGLKI